MPVGTSLARVVTVGAAIAMAVATLSGCGVASSLPAAAPALSTTGPNSPPVSRPSSQPSSQSSSRGWTVSAVIDGDTLDVTRGTRRERVRIVGINTPESDECLGVQATRTLRALVQDGPLTLRRDVSDRDAYGRLLRYVVNAQARDVGAQLVRRGLAIARRYPPDVARADRYDRLQGKAMAARRGLWSPDACGAATGADLQISGVRADAVGDDNVNLNDEWVQFTNVGQVVIDMTGWQVADESATNRYRFGSFRLRAGASVTLFSGCGRDTDTQRHWCSSSAVWNNDGDTVIVRDRNGNSVAVYTY